MADKTSDNFLLVCNFSIRERPKKQPDGTYVASVTVATEGVYQYREAPGNRWAYLPKSELQSGKFLETVNGAPLIYEHKKINPTNYNKSIWGSLFDIRTDNAGVARGKVRIGSQDAVTYLENATEPLGVSLSYRGNFITQKGVFNGQPYDSIQTDLHVNHCAIVDNPNIPGSSIQNNKEGINMSQEITLKDIENVISKTVSNKFQEASNMADEEKKRKSMETMYNEMKKMYNELTKGNKKSDIKNESPTPDSENETPVSSTDYKDVVNARETGKMVLGSDVPDNLQDTYSISEYVCNEKGLSNTKGQEAVTMLTALRVAVSNSKDTSHESKESNVRNIRGIK